MKEEAADHFREFRSRAVLKVTDLRECRHKPDGCVVAIVISLHHIHRIGNNPIRERLRQGARPRKTRMARKDRKHHYRLT